MCLESGLADFYFILRHMPKVPTNPLEEADPALELLFAVCALHIYVNCTQSLSSSEQNFVCFGG